MSTTLLHPEAEDQKQRLNPEAEDQKQRGKDQMVAKPEPVESMEDSDEEEETDDEGGWCQSSVTSQKALEYYNKSKGEEYVMVIPWSSSGFLDRQGPMFHCNFWAKAGNEIDNASASLFFAELAIVQYGEEKLYDAKVGELRVVSCEKLDGVVPVLTSRIRVSRFSVKKISSCESFLS
uniref:DUF3615 domain-containing protein n=1 Tax=Opuntia streptacantha TaxID=393608 RepID=A0A7C9CUU9_OPUST